MTVYFIEKTYLTALKFALIIVIRIVLCKIFYKVRLVRPTLCVCARAHAYLLISLVLIW